MATARAWLAAVVLKNGKVLAVGGVDATNNTLAGAELYDPSWWVGKWRGRSEMPPSPRFQLPPHHT
jgi:hypothetical protein